MYEVNVVSQHVQIASPLASLSEMEAVNTESISNSQSFHAPPISRHSNTPTKSKHINGPTPKPDKSPEESTGQAAELLLFLSGQEPNKNPQVIWRLYEGFYLYNQFDVLLKICFLFNSRNKLKRGIIISETLQAVFSYHQSYLCCELLIAALRTSNSQTNKGGRHGVVGDEMDSIPTV